MMAIDGAFACPECGAAVTAWRDDRQRGPVFDADPYDPYQRHVCRPSVALPLARMADVLERMERAYERSVARPTAPAAARATGHVQRTPERAASRPPTPAAQTARPMAGDPPRPALPARAGWGIDV